MKRRTKTALIILITVLAIFVAMFFVFFKNYFNKPIFLIPIACLILVITFLLGNLFFDATGSNENTKLKKELNIQKELYSSLAKNGETISKDLPIGIIIYDENYAVEFENDYVKNIFETSTLGKNLYFVCPELRNIISRREMLTEINIYDKKYRVNNYSNLKTVYLTDITNQKEIEKKYLLSRPSIMVLSIDNLDQALNDYDLKERTDILGKYYQVIEKWKNKFNIYGTNNQNNKQTFIITKEELNRIIDDDFSLLDDASEISRISGTDIYISIGVGTGAEDYVTLGEYANKALDLANDRGGSQAIIYDGIKSTSYGRGVNSSAEIVSKITTRFYAEKIVKQIEKASSVVIMPHIDTDADALGASLGLYHLSETLKTPARILLNLNRVDNTIKKVINASCVEYIKLRRSFISEDELPSFFTGKTLLIITDHFDDSLSPSKEVYKLATTIDVIDHHRKNMKENLKINLDYIDTNASSSVELVTQMISTLPFPVDIPPFIATIMLLGITIDTNNFSTHMNDKTFESCSFLMKHEADPFKVKMYLRESVENQKKRVDLLENAEIIDKKYAIVIDDREKNSRDVLARTAEALLNIDNIVAGFAIGTLDEGYIGISGRSNGLFNIHTEMEKFGGGGHFNTGAAQIRDGRSLADVKNQLIENLKEKIGGEKNAMKVILIEDVKKQGKKGDIIDVTPGYANYLMSRKNAIEANPANIAVLEEEKASNEKTKQEELEVARKLKKVLEEISLNIYVKTGENGKFFGSVSSKQIADALYKEQKIEIDKRKISLPDEKIESLGTFECLVRLHKDVSSKLRIVVKEEKEN